MSSFERECDTESIHASRFRFSDHYRLEHLNTSTVLYFFAFSVQDRYTERVHYFTRLVIKRVRNVAFYGVPKNICILIQRVS
jgi:hypothetical protein